MKAVFDTSSLISLQVAGLVEELLDIARILVPKTVTQELEELASYRDKEGKSARELLAIISNREKLREVKVKSKDKVESLVSKDIDRGEAECFTLCKEEEIQNLIMDDVSAAYALSDYAKAEEVDIKISVAAISELVKEKKISKKQALEAIGRISKIREWEGGVLETLAKKYFPKL